MVMLVMPVTVLVIKYHCPGELEENEFTWASHSSPELRVHPGREAWQPMAGVEQEREAE